MKALTAQPDGSAEAEPPTGRRRAPTIYEVARRAGVSIATVSRVHRNTGVVAPETRRRVERAVSELGYRPSRLGRSLARGHHDATGIVFPDLSGPYFSAVILGYEEASAAEGRSVLILATHRRPDAAAQVRELADRTDGVVVLGRTVDDEVVADLTRQGMPVVMLARPAAGTADSVRAESRASAAALSAHVFAHNRQRVVFVGDPAASPDAAERFDGFIDAHRAAGRPPWMSAVDCGYREADGEAAAAELLMRDERPDAIVCANDEIAMGVIAAARARGIRVPDDLAVTGWDDVPAARHLAPPLTTVRQPMYELGRRAAEMLRDRIIGRRSEPLHELLATELVIRSSCGCSPPDEGRNEE
jgi:LacI family transcriptional regulator